MSTFKEYRAIRGVDLGLAQKCVGAEGQPIIVGLGAYEKVTVQGVITSATAWGSAVVTLKLANCNDGPWFTIPGGSITLAAAGLTTQIDVSAYSFLMLETTTAQSGATADFHICGFGHK